MSLTIINDLHLGVKRQAGTTESSRLALQKWQRSRFSSLLDGITGALLVAGDVLDDFLVDEDTVTFVWSEFSRWVGRDSSNALFLGAGNHDWSEKAGRMSHFEMLAFFLEVSKVPNVTIIRPNEMRMVYKDVGYLAHCSNQVRFDEELSEVLDAKAMGHRISFLVLHANYDNNFAVESDNSLNVSAEMARRFTDAGVSLVFAHEHQRRVPKDQYPCIYVMGNQIPTSVSDCLGNDSKYLTVIEYGKIRAEQVWSKDDDIGFHQVDWHDLDPAVDLLGFIRVTGESTRNESAAMMQAIAKFRAKSDAFVVTNAVKVEGVAPLESLPETIEDIQLFDVISFIKGMVTEEQFKVVLELKKESDNG